MAAHCSYAVGTERLEPVLVGRFPRLQVLAWSGDWLYASRGYTIASR